MFGSRNGSLNDFRRGRRNVSTSAVVAKPLRKSSRAMQAEPQISLHGIAPPLSSSAGAMIQRGCTDQFSCCGFADNTPNKSGKTLPHSKTQTKTAVELPATFWSAALLRRFESGIAWSLQHQHVHFAFATNYIHCDIGFMTRES